MNSNKLRFINTKTPRGFDKVLFEDSYFHKCSLQISSAAIDECIWLGIENAHPQIMSTDAIKLGIAEEKNLPHNCFGQPCGWIDYPVPDEVLFTTRLHLNRKQAKQLGLKLLQFAYSGEII